MTYKDTSLWRNSIGNDSYNETELRAKLKNQYELARKNAIFLLDKIRKDFPNLTVHDITHIDNMWHIASVITGESYTINPLEGFVLGCAFLVHDAVLSYYAFGGKEMLRETVEWKDYYADDDSIVDEEQKKTSCDFKTIRLLHAKMAEKIFEQVFSKDDGTSFYIIEEKSLRIHLGELIGQIAASHHWNIDDVEKLENQFGAPAGFPIEWSINPIKIACILRCADAGHIDGNRAPDFILESMSIEGISKFHWDAQNRLSQIMIDKENTEKVVIKSNIAFKEEDSAAWNIAFDLVTLLDNELKKSNDLLSRFKTDLFQARSVKGVGSQEELSSYIKTDGWKPCDAQIHISNVEQLIKTIGGEKLYGKENTFEIVLRELIQNARDAIVARRKRESDFEGKITIKISKDVNGALWVEVIDDGIGMSINTIKEYLLNFGASFWKSDFMKSEFPGLNSSGFKSIGEFGIGFFSVFMVAKEVYIETRRYDKGLDDTIQLKFNSSYCLRPILTTIPSKSTKYSTVVRYLINDELVKWCPEKEMTPSIHGEKSFVVPYHAIVANMVAGLDVDVYYSELEKEERIVHKNIDLLHEKTPEVASWLKDISYSEFRDTDAYSKYIDENFMRLEKVYENGKFKGFIALNTLWQRKAHYLGVETVGGLSTFRTSFNVGEYIGCLITEPETARRNAVNKLFDMQEWAKSQLSMLPNYVKNYNDFVYLPYAISQYRIDISSMAMIYCYNKCKCGIEIKRLDELIQLLINTNETIVFLVSPLSTSPRIEGFFDRNQFCLSAKEGEWLFIPVDNSSFLSLEENNPQGGYSIMDYISFIAQKHGLLVKKNVEENRMNNILGEPCSALKISFVKG